MSGETRIRAELLRELDVAEAKGWDALARYKFQMFGYWAAIWVHLNRVGGFRRPNPWADLVRQARSGRPVVGLAPEVPLPFLMDPQSVASHPLDPPSAGSI